MLRTHNCGQLNKSNVGEKVILSGWVQSVRDHGLLKFIDLRDRYGVVQLVYSPAEMPPEVSSILKEVRNEWVIRVAGEVILRPPEMVNPKISTGQVEVKINQIEVLNRARNLPFELTDNIQIGEDIRLAYRFLDLRRPRIQTNLLARAKFTQAVREFLTGEDFVEIETPILTRSTPEGARDFIVPSRLNPGRFYALPQSPQLFKQILMVAGFDRYFQIARCFRDEDLRADRQPEFTQIDLEMSFVEEADVIDITEKLLKYAIRKAFGYDLQIPFPRIEYQQAMEEYGTDKPDLRFNLKLKNFTGVFQETRIEVIRKTIEEGGIVQGFIIPDGQKVSASDVEEYHQLVRQRGLGGLGWIRFRQNDIQSPFKKFLEEKIVENLRPPVESDNSLLFFLAGQPDKILPVLGELRKLVGDKLYLSPEPQWCFTWVVNFPLLEFDQQQQRWQSKHHPFTSPAPASIESLENQPEKIRAKAYDLVLNGIEIGGGSIRIHSRKLQEKMFDLIGLPRAKYEQQFGFLLECLDFGAPPHGGIALGLDRLVMLFLGENSIREVIAFPKTQKGVCLLTKAPGEVDEILLKENRIRLQLPST